jgi:D-alanyl-D-alanine carboxypeptidase/D-alanyl-D-alanine-endopeptidase (penicillin-binding protein 4)
LIADWVGDGRFAAPLQIPGDTLLKKTIGKNDFFKNKNLKYLVDGKEAKDPEIEIRFLPYEKAIQWSDSVYEGPVKVWGVGFVAPMENLDATHTGFVVFTPGEKPVLRHAAYKKQVQELPLKDYLESRKGKLPGITLFEFLQTNN